MGDEKKKSPNSNHAHRTTSHKTAHHWERRGHMVGICGVQRGGGAAFEKMQPPQWETDGLSSLK